MSKTASFITVGVVGVVVGLGAAALINYVATGSAIGPPERLTTGIALTLDANGMCQVSDPDAVWAKRGHTVTWSISNNCNTPQTLQFRNFQEKNPDGTLGAPATLFNPAQPTTVPAIPAGAQSVPVQATLQHQNGNPSRHIFKYEIWIGPTAAALQKGRDPDIETWD
jgi:hypothetical protein